MNWLNKTFWGLFSLLVLVRGASGNLAVSLHKDFDCDNDFTESVVTISKAEVTKSILSSRHKGHRKVSHGRAVHWPADEAIASYREVLHILLLLLPLILYYYYYYYSHRYNTPYTTIICANAIRSLLFQDAHLFRQISS
jgi:hypothetical protein